MKCELFNNIEGKLVIYNNGIAKSVSDCILTNIDYYKNLIPNRNIDKKLQVFSTKHKLPYISIDTYIKYVGRSYYNNKMVDITYNNDVINIKEHDMQIDKVAYTDNGILYLSGGNLYAHGTNTANRFCAEHIGITLVADSLIDTDVICMSINHKFIIYSKPSGTYICGKYYMDKQGKIYNKYKVSNLVFDQIMHGAGCIIGTTNGKVYRHKTYNNRYLKRGKTTTMIFRTIPISPRCISFNKGKTYYEQDGNVHELDGMLVWENSQIISNRNTFTLASSRFYAVQLILITKYYNIRMPKMLVIHILKIINDNLIYENGKFRSVLKY